MTRGRGAAIGLRALLSAATVAVLMGLAGPIPAAERMIDVQGRMTDAEGRGLAGQSVRLFKTRREVTIGRHSSGGQVAEAARVLTDDGGFYRLTVPKDRSFDSFFLRFFDPNGFDSVQYAPPPDREITRDLKRGSPLRIDVTIQPSPAWPEVSRRIQSAGADSPMGKILRALGLPEREEQGAGPDGPRTEWWYHTRGVVYFFHGAEAAGLRRFEPVKPAAVQAAAAGGGR